MIKIKNKVLELVKISLIKAANVLASKCVSATITQALAARHAGILLTRVGGKKDKEGVRWAKMYWSGAQWTQGHSGPNCKAQESPSLWGQQVGDNRQFLCLEAPSCLS